MPQMTQVEDSLRKQALAVSSAIKAGGFSPSDKTLHALLDAIPTLIRLCSEDHESTYLNARWLQFTGRKIEDELRGGWVAGIHPEDVTKIFPRKREKEAAEGQPTSLKYRLQKSDGRYESVIEISVPLTLANGTRCGYLGCVDASDRRDSAKTQRDIAERLFQAQEAERTRIARELHDDIGQRLAILRIEMLRAGKPVSDLPGATHPGIKDLSDKVREIADKVATLSHQLHSPELEYLGVKTAIESACREFTKTHRIPAACFCDKVPANVDGLVGLSLLRLLQEALHNIVKHSGATKVEVRLTGSDDTLTLEIVDDGHGFDVEQARLAAGLGLISMRERMHMVGGELKISSAPGKGSRIVAHAPVTKSKQVMSSV